MEWFVWGGREEADSSYLIASRLRSQAYSCSINSVLAQLSSILWSIITGRYFGGREPEETQVNKMLSRSLESH